MDPHVTSLRIYLINLDRDTARLAWMTRQLEAAGLCFERIPAVAGRAVPQYLLPFFSSDGIAVNSRLEPGEVGCYAGRS